MIVRYTCLCISCKWGEFPINRVLSGTANSKTISVNIMTLWSCIGFSPQDSSHRGKGVGVVERGVEDSIYLRKEGGGVHNAVLLIVCLFFI